MSLEQCKNSCIVCHFCVTSVSVYSSQTTVLLCCSTAVLSERHVSTITQSTSWSLIPLFTQAIHKKPVSITANHQIIQYFTVYSPIILKLSQNDHRLFHKSRTISSTCVIIQMSLNTSSNSATSHWLRLRHTVTACRCSSIALTTATKRTRELVVTTYFRHHAFCSSAVHNLPDTASPFS